MKLLSILLATTLLSTTTVTTTYALPTRGSNLNNDHVRSDAAAVATRDLGNVGMLSGGPPVAARELVLEIIHLLERRGARASIDSPSPPHVHNTRRDQRPIMSPEQENACRARGGTPETVATGSGSTSVGNVEVGCSLDPVPVRRTPWRKGE